ncbi:MAG TPA: DUF308 domain-containing protein [Pseudonocardiaceae bacterium]|nr:DUF308 domain-containing protein [Pseudonocardiaceae bacterium]
MVAVPDPEEPDRDAARRDGAEDTDAVFAGIIANWRAEPDAPRWPADTDPLPEEPAVAALAGIPRPADDEGHYQPPEPPPLPVPHPRTLGGMLLLAVGVLLLVQPSLLELGESVATPLGLLAITVGIGALVFGLRGGPPREGWDDGAQL